ncbi:DUF3307 domain-containing protein [Paractinoplanes ferrugineus]|nr:DUF3307 domain-containing protein [Actinoplanes ferrugineus]
MSAEAVTFAASIATLSVAHQLGDHIFQRDLEAAHKADAGWSGWRRMAVHVGVYHLVATIMLLVTAVVLDLRLSVAGVVVGLAFSAASHALIDRRWPVRWILQHLEAPAFAERQVPVSGMYLADQALHLGGLWVSALLIACL